MTIAILVAPATRIGYLLYPVDFFVWAWLLRSEDARLVPALAVAGSAGPTAVDGDLSRSTARRVTHRRGARQSSSVTANSLTVNDVVRPEPEPKVVGATVTPISHS